MKVLVAPSALLAGVLACTVAETAICGRCQPIPQRLTMTIRASPTVLPSLHAVQDGRIWHPAQASIAAQGCVLFRSRGHSGAATLANPRPTSCCVLSLPREVLLTARCC